MNTYSVLLVDDEEEVIQVIMKKIDWSGLGFSVIGYANNGVKALEMVEEYQPDVVMTDIKMPYMDGMELSAHIKAQYPATKILIFTGFDEFEYAKEAVHLEVEEYILKPVSSVELTRVFQQMKGKLDQEIDEKRNIEILQKYYLESLPILRMNFYSALIEGRIQEDDIPGYLQNYQVSFTGPCYCCLVIHTSSNEVPDDMNPLLLFTSVQKQAQEYLSEKWKMKYFTYMGNTIVIAQLTDKNEASELTDECQHFCRYVHRMIGANVTIGIGHVCDKISDLSQSYNSAREAVSYRVIYGTSRAINMKEIAPQEISRSSSQTEAELADLFKAIRLSSEDIVIENVRKYFEHTFQDEKSLQQYQVNLMELLSALYRFANRNDIEMEGFSGDIRKLYGNLLDLESEYLKNWITNMSLDFRQKLIRARSSSNRSFVTRAREYVRNNYANEELSLDDICAVLGVSNSYFSTIFKKETGNSFIGYLTDYRMEQASRMLIETNEKSYMIGKQVGYTDPNYFSYVFKRKFGVSPSKYRTEHVESER